MQQNFSEQLQRQLSFIETSCKQFDAGNRQESIRIATSIRVLCHDTKASTSLLSHLKAKHINILTTTDGLKENSMGMAFGAILMTPTFRGYIPNLDRCTHKNLIPVAEWWDKQIIYAPGFSNRFARKDIVLGAANKDGGAHVDEQLDPLYAQVASPGFMGSITSTKRGEVSTLQIEDAHLVALRQMGYEILNSPELLAFCNEDKK